MRYAVFSDIHSNLEALQSMWSAYKEECIDKYICAGDIVGYGANPKECIKFIKEENIAAICGNHDWACTGRFSLDYFNPHAKEAVLWTRGRINSQDISYLDSLELSYQEDDFCIVHGTLVNPVDFDYMFDLEDAKDSFAVLNNNICFVGHTHIPAVFVKTKDKVSYTDDNTITIEPQNQYIINVGSVGQPRDRDNRACFCIYDTKERVVQIKRIDYDIKTAQSKIMDSGLPSFLATRLNAGM